MHRFDDICSIRMGYSVRGRLEPCEHGVGVAVIQLKDVGAAASVKFGRLSRAALDDIDDRFIVSQSDLVFKPRGPNNVAAMICDVEGPVYALAPLLILRPREDVVMPDYLAWYINQKPAQQHFDTCARGTNMRMIPRECLASLEVDVPNLETQQKIVEVAGLAAREGELLREVADKRSQLMSFVLLDRARKTQPRSNEAGS